MTKWTFEHWFLLILFVAGLFFEEIRKAATWADVLTTLSPSAVAGMFLSTIAFVRAIYVGKPRESYGDRRGDV